MTIIQNIINWFEYNLFVRHEKIVLIIEKISHELFVVCLNILTPKIKYTKNMWLCIEEGFVGESVCMRGPTTLSSRI